jgi:hypothetical protein
MIAAVTSSGLPWKWRGTNAVSASAMPSWWAPAICSTAAAMSWVPSGVP